MRKRIPDRPQKEMMVNKVVEVVQLVTTGEARSAEVDVINHQNHLDRHPAIRPDHEIVLDEL